MKKSKNIQTKIKELSLGDNRLETDLAHLYFQSFLDLKEKYASGIRTKNSECIRFIRHKYRSSFFMLGLTELQLIIDNSSDLLAPDTPPIATQRSVEKVSKLCDQVLKQLLRAYPSLNEAYSLRPGQAFV